MILEWRSGPEGRDDESAKDVSGPQVGSHLSTGTGYFHVLPVGEVLLLVITLVSLEAKTKVEISV